MAQLLGVRIDNYSRAEARKKLVEFLNSSEQHMIFTPNPEMLVAACKNITLRNVLNHGSLNIADGRGITLFRRVPRIQGVDFVMDVCVEAERLGKSVYLLGSGDPETVLKTSAQLRILYPKLDLVGRHEGPILNKNGEGDSTLIIEDINRAKPDILLVAFGHEKQELWISKHLHELPTVKVAMGVGGSFDFISGKIKRAPRVFRSLGVEWVWRLLIEPWRCKRIATAVVIFPILSIFVGNRYDS